MTFSLQLQFNGLFCGAGCHACGPHWEVVYPGTKPLSPKNGRPDYPTPRLPSSRSSRGGPCQWCGSIYRCECQEALESLDFFSEEFIEFPGKDPEQESTSIGSLDHIGEACSRSSVSFPLEEGPELSPLVHTPVENPDFNGRWWMHSVEGAIDELLTESGVGWALLQVTKRARYGAGMLNHNITHKGDTITIDHWGCPLPTGTTSFKVGGGAQRTYQEDNILVIIDPKWDAHTIVIKGRFENGKPTVPSRRYLIAPDMMVFQSTTSKGSVVRRYYQKK